MTTGKDVWRPSLWRVRVASDRCRLVTRALGAAQAVQYLVQTRWRRDPRRVRPYVLRAKSARHRLLCRPRTSDLDVFRQVFIDRDYACFDDLAARGVIVDCGANVGYVSAYFLSRFPDSKVIAVEPDPANFALLERNLAPYGDRVTLIEAALWSRRVGLRLSEAPFRDGREWSVSVRECREGETPDVRGVDLGTLLEESGSTGVFILKMDVEGAESVVFADGAPTWLPAVENIAIELHDDSPFGPASTVFLDAIRQRPFEVTASGELTVCRLRSPE